MSLECEKLSNAGINGGGKKKWDHFPHKCYGPAAKYKVSGQSFTAFAILCKTHAKQAQREGFELEIVNG